MVTAATTALDDTDEHSTTALYRAAIGDISNAYYLPRFTRFEAAERPGLSWNWAAALNTLNWLMFRQLWHAALLYSGSIVALALLLFGIGKLVFQFSEGTQWGLLAAIGGLAFAVPGLGGNALYYLATRQRVQKALSQNQTVADACAQLSKVASTRKRLIVIAVCNAIALGVGAQSYSMFSGFEPLPAGTPVAVTTAPEAHRVASGRAVDANGTDAAGLPRSAASNAVAPAPAKEASATSRPVSAPQTQVQVQTAPASSKAASAASAASSPVASPVSAPARAAAPSAAPPAPVVSAKAAPTNTAKPVAKPSADKSSTSPQGVNLTPMRSEAAVNAAREVAAALGQSAPSVETKPRSSTATATATPSPQPPGAGRFVVNVGLFADSNNARNALVKLTDAELPVVSKEIRFPKGSRTRLQVGPFDTLAEADAAADKVRALELEARVAPAP